MFVVINSIYSLKREKKKSDHASIYVMVGYVQPGCYWIKTFVFYTSNPICSILLICVAAAFDSYPVSYIRVLGPLLATISLVQPVLEWLLGKTPVVHRQDQTRVSISLVLDSPTYYRTCLRWDCQRMRRPYNAGAWRRMRLSSHSVNGGVTSLLL